MLELDVLSPVDFHAWFGCQQAAARQVGCNQSTVSRRVREVARLATLHSSVQDCDFLTLEREVHQRWRFTRGCELRLHAYRWIHPLLDPQLPDTWIANPAAVAVTRACPLQLLRDHVIDALLAPWPVVAGVDRTVFALMPVYSAPLLLLASGDSPLSHERGLSAQDIATASRLGDLAFVPPTAAACSRHLDAQLFDAEGRGPRPEAPSPPTCRYWGTPLTPLVRGDLVALDYRTPIPYTEVLVCLRHWREHGEILRLLESITASLSALSGKGPQLETVRLEAVPLEEMAVA